MLSELFIRNFAIIDELRLRLNPGFNVLTGETGAGKSIILLTIPCSIVAGSSLEPISSCRAS